jgi:hypothetical protein
MNPFYGHKFSSIKQIDNPCVFGKTQPGYLMDTCLSGQDQYKALLAKFDIKGKINEHR